MAACPRDPRLELTPDQQAVVTAAERYAVALGKSDYEGMWNLLSPSSQEWVVRNLEGEGGVRMTIALKTKELETNALAGKEKAEAEAYLARMPKAPELKEMTGKDYYIWQLKRTVTDAQRAETARLFNFSNVREVVVPANSDMATLVLKAGDPDRYTFVRARDGWKLELPQKRLLDLDAARMKEVDAIPKKEHDESRD
ncbi:MAG: hypothetical protein IT462_04070 [Planctomycetes bacterium]|nr:hypothetical protein [Planctomycetota bacterium]